MGICPNCGYKNADEAETCLRCDYPLVEPGDEPAPAAVATSIAMPGAVDARPALKLVAPIPTSSQPPAITPAVLRFSSLADKAAERAAAVLLFLLGVGLDLAIGFAFAAVNPQTLNSNIYFLFLGMLVLGILFIFQKKTRLFGYGMLAGAFAFPIWIQSSCSPILYFR